VNCPECDEGGVRTVDTRSFIHTELNFYFVVRRKVCLSCSHKYKTIEVEKPIWDTILEGYENGEREDAPERDDDEEMGLGVQDPEGT
jgi:transcriptional regulator NrdR family protein